MVIGDVVNLIPTAQAAGLAAHNVSKIKNKNLNTKDILELGVTNVVGVGLIKATADIGSTI